MLKHGELVSLFQEVILMKVVDTRRQNVSSVGFVRYFPG